MIGMFDKTRVNKILEYSERVISSFGYENPKTKYSLLKMMRSENAINERKYSGFMLKIVKNITDTEREEDCENSTEIFYGIPFFRKPVFKMKNGIISKFEGSEDSETPWEGLLAKIDKEALEILEEEKNKFKGVNMNLNYPQLSSQVPHSGLNF